MIYTLAVLLTISIVVNILAFFGTRNLLHQNETYEDYFQQLQSGLISVQDEMKRIDISGAFEADDQVGIIFAGLKGMIMSLSTFLMKDK